MKENDSPRAVRPTFTANTQASRAAEATTEFAVGHPTDSFPELLLSIADALREIDSRLKALEKGQAE